MKRNVWLLCITVLLTVCWFESQAQLVSDTARLSESVWSMKKKKIVLEYLDLTEAEKASFWPLYESYNQAIQYLELETREILDLYENHASTLKPREIERYTQQILLNDLLLAKVRRQYYRKFSKALSPKIAAQFMQLDKAMRLMIQEKVEPRQLDELAKASLK